MNRLLSVRECADLLGIASSTVYQKRALLQLPEVRVGRRVMFDVIDVNAWIERHKTQNPGAANEK